MDDAFQRFQADLAGVGQTGMRGPPPGYMGGPPPGPPPMGGPPMFHPPPFPPPPHMGGYGGPPPGQPFYGGMPPGMGMPYGTGAVAAMRSSAAVAGGQAGGASGSGQGAAATEAEAKKKGGLLREAAGKRWRDPTLDEWPENDFRIFVGNLGNDVSDDVLAKTFQKYPSFAKAKIVKDKRTKKSKGYGFVSFLESNDFAKCLKEMHGKYIGNRPCQLRKSSWDERNAMVPQGKKQKQGGNKKQQQEQQQH